jgi:hypothetical protein
MSEELDEDSTFTRKIEHNHDICSNCYRRMRYRLEPHNTLPSAVSEQMEYTSSAYFGHFGDEDNTGRPSVKKSYCECGFVDDGKIRPLNEKDFMETAVRVRNRLSEEGIEIDEDVFFGSVKEHIPEHKFNEEKVIENAVDESIITEE